MFQVLNHREVVFSGELSQTTQYVIEHFGGNLDKAIRSGITIVYGGPPKEVAEAMISVAGSRIPEYCQPIEGWEPDCAERSALTILSAECCRKTSEILRDEL